jgi:hypothetical protein
MVLLDCRWHHQLVPLNPRRLPAYISGSILSQDLTKSADVVSKPWENAKLAANYLRSSHNATHARQRAAEVFLDTVKINLAAEGRPFMGPVVAGQMANKAASGYQHKIIANVNALPPQ